MHLLDTCLGGLAEVFYPETCAWCGAFHGDKPWDLPGRRVPGLRKWDRSHVCLPCSRHLSHLQPVRRTGRDGFPVWGGTVTDGKLVDVVSAWKYHGLRGLAWPLSRLAVSALSLAISSSRADPLLVPIPLHDRRRRKRGFNQAELLACLLQEEAGFMIDRGLLVRCRATAQQARIPDPESRRRNVADAFRVQGTPVSGRTIILLDDLVTTGATVRAAAAALTAAGLPVAGAVCLGLVVSGRGAGPPGGRVDTCHCPT